MWNLERYTRVNLIDLETCCKIKKIYLLVSAKQSFDATETEPSKVIFVHVLIPKIEMF